MSSDGGKRKSRRSNNPFDLALQRLPVVQMKRIAIKHEKSFSHCVAREDYVDLLRTTLSPAQKVQELRETVLAKRGALIHYKFVDADVRVSPKAVSGPATDRPKIVSVGKLGELHDGQQLIQWAMKLGSLHYTDTELNLVVDGQAAVFDSFYEPESGVLQVRASIGFAKKIRREWAEQAEIDSVAGIAPLALTSKDEVHDFADLIDGSIEKCKGHKIKGKGFLKVSGEKNPTLSDLRGTDDYRDFLAETVTTDFQIAFAHNGAPCKIGFGLESGSIVVLKNADEDVVQYVYHQLKKFRGL